MPGPLVAVGASGKLQTRATGQIGRRWDETYGPMDMEDPAVRDFVARLNNWRRNATVVDVAHPGVTTLGAGGGTPLVNGASQTGSNLVTDGWPVSTAVLLAGDVIGVVGLNHRLDVTADVTSSGTGTATIPINPPILAGGSPANNASISISPVFLCKIVGITMPRSGRGRFYRGLQIVLQEQV